MSLSQNQFPGAGVVSREADIRSDLTYVCESSGVVTPEYWPESRYSYADLMLAVRRHAEAAGYGGRVSHLKQTHLKGDDTIACSGSADFEADVMTRSTSACSEQGSSSSDTHPPNKKAIRSNRKRHGKAAVETVSYDMEVFQQSPKPGLMRMPGNMKLAYNKPLSLKCMTDGENEPGSMLNKQPHQSQQQQQQQRQQESVRVSHVFPVQMVSPLVEPQDITAGRLFDAISNHDLEAVRALLRAGADPNAFTPKGTHVLFRAVSKAKDPAIVRVLLESGADPKAVDASGNEVLHFWARATAAAESSLQEVGMLLLQAGADSNAARHEDLMTPLHHIVVHFNNRRKWSDIHKAALLLTYGASLIAKTRQGKTPFDMIVRNTRIDTRRLRELLTPVRARCRVDFGDLQDA